MKTKPVSVPTDDEKFVQLNDRVQVTYDSILKQIP
jgi:hypothetical protein